MKEFFVVTLPGLEDLALKELNEWTPGLSAKVQKGGLHLQAPMAVGLSLNYVLKIPTRILVRVNQFSCRDFPKLFQTIATGIQWSDWIQPYVKLEAHASTHGSRLKMKKRIEETCVEAWQAYQSKRKARVSKDHGFEMFVRIQDNRCTLSLDTTGERLHKRGERQHVGEAPLRESIAAALLQMLSGGSTAQVELVDPMTGSGTFLLEAATRDLPTAHRDFPHACFRETPAPIPTLSAPRPYFKKLVGFELDSKTLAAARRNLKTSSAQLEWINQDFLLAESMPAKQDTERWVICNPPYGERLKVEGSLMIFYANLFSQVERVCQPDRACFLVPLQAEGKIQLPKAWRILEARRFSNGGIPVSALLFTRK